MIESIDVKIRTIIPCAGGSEQAASGQMEVGTRPRFNASPVVNTSIVRFVASPPLAPHALEDVAGAVAVDGANLLLAVNDPDVNASVICAEMAADAWRAALEALAARFTPNLCAGRAFRVDLMTGDPTDIGDEALRSVAVGLHGAFSAPVFIAHRDKPAAAWAFARPMPWGRKGLAVGQTAPALPFGGSECLGVAIEVGPPTILAKARLEGVPEHGLIKACAAIGGADSGFAEVGAYPGVSAGDGASVVVLEFGNVARSPIHRALAVLDIEARRYGGHLGQTALLSHIPLDALLEVLRAETGLSATRAQVLETHLPKNGAR